MLILAFESSAKPASAALVKDGQLLSQYMQCSALTHSRTLLPMAEDMLKKENQVQGLFNRALDSKLSAKIKETAKLDKKTVSKEEFNKLFAE